MSLLLENVLMNVNSHQCSIFYKPLKTDSYYRNANLNWDKTKILVRKETKNKGTVITQGFIASDLKGYTTTLGREGSDYTAAIFAFILNAEFLTIWKDVPGVLNADPRYFETTQLLENISYREAIELAYYGASVIHPKTLQPLQRKEIPLFVKSFEEPKSQGTKVFKGSKLIPFVPCFILKKNQILLQLSTLDFSFIVEENISEIFSLMDKYKMRVEMIQNSAISFAVCINDKYGKLTAPELGKKYQGFYTDSRTKDIQSSKKPVDRAEPWRKPQSEYLQNMTKEGEKNVERNKMERLEKMRTDHDDDKSVGGAEDGIHW